MLVSIITPWLDHPEFIADYERALTGPNVQVIVIDNGSSAANAPRIRNMVNRLGGTYIRNEQNRWFAPANNQGLAKASGEVVIFLNNDIAGDGPGWMDAVRRDVAPNMLAGPSVRKARVAQWTLPYIDGWCIAGRREVWDLLRGWNEEAFKMPYWEDTELSFRANKAGVRLLQTNWPLKHKWNGTAVTIPAARSSIDHNRDRFISLLAGQRATDQGQPRSEEAEFRTLADYLKAGQLSTAESDFARTTTDQPQNARAWLSYGAVLGCCGRYDAAIDALHKATELEPALRTDASREMDNIIAGFNHALQSDPFNQTILGERRRLQEKWNSRQVQTS